MSKYFKPLCKLTLTLLVGQRLDRPMAHFVFAMTERGVVSVVIVAGFVYMDLAE